MYTACAVFQSSATVHACHPFPIDSVQRAHRKCTMESNTPQITLQGTSLQFQQNKAVSHAGGPATMAEEQLQSEKQPHHPGPQKKVEQTPLRASTHPPGSKTPCIAPSHVGGARIRPTHGRITDDKITSNTARLRVHHSTPQHITGITRSQHLYGHALLDAHGLRCDALSSTRQKKRRPCIRCKKQKTAITCRTQCHHPPQPRRQQHHSCRWFSTTPHTPKHTAASTTASISAWQS